MSVEVSINLMGDQTEVTFRRKDENWEDSLQSDGPCTHTSTFPGDSQMSKKRKTVSTLDDARIVAFCPEKGLMVKTPDGRSAFLRVSVATSFGFNNKNQQKFVRDLMGEREFNGWGQEEKFWPRIRATYKALCLQGLAHVLPDLDGALDPEGTR